MKLVLAFRLYLEQLGYSKSSLNMLPTCLKEFLLYFDLNLDSSSIYSLQSKEIKLYYSYLQERPNKRRPGGLSERFIAHHIYALKLFFHWQLELGNIDHNPVHSLHLPSPKSTPKTILTTCEIKKLYTNCETHFERAILSLCYGCGLRRSEAIKLNIEDVHLRINMLYVRHGKNNKRRAVPLSESVKKDLENYAINERRPNKDEKGFLCNSLGNRTSGSTIYKRFKALLILANIQKDCPLHSLRHSIATHLLENGLHVEFVRDFLGHKHLESTQVYTHSISPIQEI